MLSFDDLEKYANNPSRIIGTVFKEIEATFSAGSGTLNSKSHPFSYAVDLIVGTNYGFISRLGDNTAKKYPVHARNLSDLSKVMCDEDWYGVFSEPSNLTWRWIVSEEVINSIALEYTDTDGTQVNTYKKVVLPPDSQFTVAGIPFLLENPVEIRVMDHGGYQVVYDSSYNSPLKPLVGNSPDREILNIDNRKYLSVHLPMRQLEITERGPDPVNVTTGYRSTIEFKDKLFAVRAFITPDGSDNRYEMSVVFNNDNFDPNQPTLTIDLIDESSFEASIPSVYLQNETALGRITLLIYTTKGEYSQDLSTLKSQEHTVGYFDYRNKQGKLGKYSLPLRDINEVTVDTITPISGGLNGATFTELKNMVIYGHRRRQVPISNSDFTQTLERLGYDSIKSIDTVSGRLYRTTKDLPIQENKLFEDESMVRFNSSIGTHTGTVLTSLEELIASGNAIDNGRRVTVIRGSVFDITNQTNRLLPIHEVESLVNSNNQTKIDTMATKSMVYTPFMYVIDTMNDRAAVRCYRVAKPEIKYQTFRYENANLGIQVGIGSINILSSKTGYTVNIKTKSSDAYKELSDDTVSIQLMFKTAGSNVSATMKGTLLGRTEDKERIFSFDLGSNFDIDDNNLIDLKGFKQFGKPQDEIRVNLDETVNFIFTYSGEGQVLKSTADFKIDQSLFTSLNVAIIETEYKISFGKNLRSLYTRIRPVVGSAQYAKYTENVPDVYPDDVYKKENGKLVIVDGKAVLEHRKGEPRMTNETPPKPIWKYLKDQTVYDEHGKPVMLHPRLIKYHWDFIGFDFNYLLSQDDYDATYVGLVEDFFANEVNDQLVEFNKQAIDETRILFKPRSTMGFTQIVINEGIEKTIRSDIKLSVTYYLTDEGITDNDLQNVLITNTHKVANDEVRKQTFSLSSLITALRTPDIIDVKVVAMAGNDFVDVISNVDDTNGFSIRKALDQTSDRLLTIREDIEIVFKRHLNN